MQSLYDDLNLYIIYLKSNIILSKEKYSCWQEIQDKYPTYQASLGPWSKEEVVDFFNDDFGENDSHWPFLSQEIESFVFQIKFVFPRQLLPNFSYVAGLRNAVQK